MAQSIPSKHASRRLHRLQEDVPNGPFLLMSPVEVHTGSNSFHPALSSTPRGRHCPPAPPCPAPDWASVLEIQFLKFRLCPGVSSWPSA